MRWEKNEVEFLIENYPKRKHIDWLVKHLNKSRRAIRHKAARLGFSRNGMLVRRAGDRTPREIIDRRYYLKNKEKIILKKMQRKLRIKEKMVKICGGKCSLCGYKTCLAALEFHHKSDNKDFSVTELIKNSSEQNVLKEVQRCILVCANCHRELHSMGA